MKVLKSFSNFFVLRCLRSDEESRQLPANDVRFRPETLDSEKVLELLGVSSEVISAWEVNLKTFFMFKILRSRAYLTEAV